MAAEPREGNDSAFLFFESRFVDNVVGCDLILEQFILFIVNGSSDRFH